MNVAAGETGIELASVELAAVVVAVRDGEPFVLTVPEETTGGWALPSGPLRQGHRTLQAGLRDWVEARAHRRLGYVEQLYTFGDWPGDPVASRRRRVAIAYLALTTMEHDAPSHWGRWRRWYEFLPWEDVRHGHPPAWSAMVDALAGAESPVGGIAWRDQLDLLFGTAEVAWDDERTLDRYETLYAHALVPEAFQDRDAPVPASVAALPGASLAFDHRRVLATAISRLRAKIKYRPVLFELMPPTFTLLQLQKTTEALSGVALHKQNFRRLVAQQGLVEETGAVTSDTGGRPAKLMRFRREVTLERPAPGVRLGGARRTPGP